MFKRWSFKKVGQIFISGFLVLQILFAYAGYLNVPVAQAQLNTNTPVPADRPVYGGVEDSVKEYLCVPQDSNFGGALFQCITRVYKFGVAFGAIALVFFVVFAGYLYITGGEGTKERGKSMFVSSLIGMAIILSSYVLLGFISPDLIKIKPIQPPIFTANNLPFCKDVGLGVNCVLPNGQVSPGNGGGYTGGGTWTMPEKCSDGTKPPKILDPNFNPYNIGGYNVTTYATDPCHEISISNHFYNMRNVDLSTADKVTAFMRSKASRTPLTGQMIISSANKFNVSVQMLLAILLQDSLFGTLGKGARSNNPGNVGNDDTGAIVVFPSWEAGVDAAAKQLARRKI